MGLFSSGGKGNSRANTTSTASTTNQTTNNVDNRIFYTDQGALGIAGDIADGAIKMARDTTDAALTEGFDFGSRALDSSYDFGAKAIDALSGSADRAMDFGRDVVGGNFEFARDLFGDAVSAVSGVLKEGQLQLGNTVTNLNAIARQQSTSTDERVQSIAGQAMKVGAVMVGLLVLAFIYKKG